MSIIHRLAAAAPVLVEIDAGGLRLRIARLAVGDLVALGTPDLPFDLSALAPAAGSEPGAPPDAAAIARAAAALQGRKLGDLLSRSAKTHAALAVAAVREVYDDEAAAWMPLRLVGDVSHEAPDADTPRLWVGRLPGATIGEIAAAVRAQEGDAAKAIRAFRGVRPVPPGGGSGSDVGLSPVVAVGDRGSDAGAGAGSGVLPDAAGGGRGSDRRGGKNRDRSPNV